ncbi:MAG TPA: hypothetical protein VII84_03740 [Acidimicrobiales bacterium]
MRSTLSIADVPDHDREPLEYRAAQRGIARRDDQFDGLRYSASSLVSPRRST